MVGITADRSYGPAEEVRIPSSQDFVRFEFEGASMHTRPERMVYMYRLWGHDDWRQTPQRLVTYGDLPLGDYIFEVMAVDRDLNYSLAPARVNLTVHPAYGQLALMVGLALALVGLVTASRSAFHRRRERDQAREQARQARVDTLRRTAACAISTDTMPVGTAVMA